MNTFFRFIFTKLFLKQFLLAIVISAVLFLATVIGLRIFTHHGEAILVPDIKGYNEAQVARVISANNLRYEIIDSIYTEEVLPGTVFDQIPPAGAFVKEDRKLFLILNAIRSERVIMPSLKNVSLRQAKVMITQNGLKLGQIIYVSSEYKDLVINQLMNDTLVTPGAMVRKFSTVDLYVGRGLGASQTAVPYLRGMYLIDALKSIEHINLNKGTMIKDGTIDEGFPLDSAIVWKQYPQPAVDASQGKAVDLWLTMDTAVVFAADTTLRLR
ncbi:MAG: PASTA domain-containing protein [Bacteroidales bacterium]|jgi:beta-lactam-binding protein with PASTA domain|nr:PASTA domain-containing protein [Bacteroidales bacterium]